MCFFAIATEMVGFPLRIEELSNDERWEAVRALHQIHRNGFLHNDVREGNILVQRNKNGFKVNIIVFAFSTSNTDEGLFSDEISCLKELLGLSQLPFPLLLPLPLPTLLPPPSSQPRNTLQLISYFFVYCIQLGAVEFRLCIYNTARLYKAWPGSS